MEYLPQLMLVEAYDIKQEIKSDHVECPHSLFSIKMQHSSYFVCYEVETAKIFYWASKPTIVIVNAIAY